MTLTSADRARQYANLAAAVGQVALSAYVIRARTDSFSNPAPGGDPPIIPARYAFAIWLPIYAGCVAYAVYQALPRQASRPLLRRVGWSTAIAFAVTSAWLLAAQRPERVWLTVVLLAIINASLAVAARTITDEKTLSRADRLLVAAPIDVFFGWASVAVFANLAAALRYSGVTSAGHETGVTLVMLILATSGVAGAIAALERSAAYTGAVLWALVAIAVANRSGETRPPNPVVAVAAVVAALVVLVCAWRVRTRR